MDKRYLLAASLSLSIFLLGFTLQGQHSPRKFEYQVVDIRTADVQDRLKPWGDLGFELVAVEHETIASTDFTKLYLRREK